MGYKRKIAAKALLDAVVDDADATVITRRDAQDTVVMSLDYYNSLMETVHLLRSPANAEHLNRSIAQFRAGQATRRALQYPDAVTTPATLVDTPKA
ncbi:type II toxin-antitoxin system Phd/YefM family antitoxin [Kushneria aurantia]|uniref:Antitoxin n=1 Tax=Kushneria aurantia TaxID=504092 RepID=A0ABV6G1B6_9GAMM|nr:type II toxin-antitoxin system Phd/YefM family antitoxin [Kushneria aurantia]